MKARRSNGDGAIDKIRRARKDGTIVERWRGRVSLGLDPKTGKARRITLYAKTRAELATKIARLNADASRGIVPSRERTTVSAFVQRWLDDVMAARVRPTTLELYRSLAKNHIFETIGARRLDALTAQDVQGILSTMQRDGKSERTQALVLTTLSSALDQAVKWDLVPRNVASIVDKPRSARGEMLTLNREQVALLLQEAATTRFYALYVLALTCGLRRGELLGLQWADVDFDKCALSVVRSIVTLHGKPIVADTKTAKGRRRIDLPSVAVRALREHRARLMAENRMAPWIFPSEAASPICPRNFIRRSFEPMLRSIQAKVDEEAAKAGRLADRFPAIRFHDLRHTAATMMLELGVQPKVVQERLGHASIAVTMDTYSHVMPSMQREAADRVDALFSEIRASGA